MSQQSNDDLARALEGLGETKPKTPGGAPLQPASKISQIKIRQLPAKPAQPSARPAQPAGAAHPAANPPQAPRPLPIARAAGGTSSVPVDRTSRAASPLDSPAALASAIQAQPTSEKLSKTPVRGRATLARTMIPILLTLGFILVALSAARFFWKSIDNPMLSISPTGAYAVGGFGVLIWVLAAFVMAGVARQLRASGAIPVSAAAQAAAPVQNRPSRAARPD